MPMDIRAYFSKTPESKSSLSKPLENGSTKPKKSRKRVLIDSDSDDDSPKTPSAGKGQSSKKKTKSEKNGNSKYFELSKNDVSNIFGKGPIKRVEQPKIVKMEKTKEALIADIDWEDDFDLSETSANDKMSPVVTSCSSSRTLSQEQKPTEEVKVEKLVSPNGSTVVEHVTPTKKSSKTHKSPTKKSKIQESPTKKSSKIQESPTKKSKIQESPTKKSSKIQESPTKKSKIQESPTKKSLKIQESPTKKSSKIQESPNKVKQTKLSPIKLPIKVVKSPKKSEPEKHDKPEENTSKYHEMSPSPERDVESLQSPTKRRRSPRKSSSLSNNKKNSAPSLTNLGIKSSTLPTNTEPDKKKMKLDKDKVKSEDNLVVKPPQFSRTAKVEDDTCKLWVDKYKPSNLKQIIGQQGEKSNVNKLVKWLKSWFSNQSGQKKIPRPSPWAKDDSGAYFKAALLSGPPGVGKTTTVHLVCKELSMDIVEFNASDTRSKKLLKEEISDLLKSKSLSGFVTGGPEVSKHHVLVMDEVDGMAGNEDRGGVQELIQLIKTSRVPIICMCNDRNHPKIRSLANYCFDLRFSKPRVEQIKGAMMSVCFKEGLKLKPDVLNDIIVNTNQDIRLILNHLSMLAAQNAMAMPSASKYVKIGPWDVLRKVFSKKDHENMSIYDKCDLFFYDYNIAPLFVQENYLNVAPHSEESKTKKGKMALFAKAASSLAYGDLVERAIRSSNAWSLLPVQAVFSSYIPGEHLVGHVAGQINFPSWLGKNSRRGKLDRMSQEIQAHTRLKISGSKEAISLDYAGAMKARVVRPLVDRGVDGIEDSLSLLREYSLLREDLDSLSEITAWPNLPDPFSKLESKVKSAFTRAYNKNPVVTPFSINAAVKKGRAAVGAEEMELDDEHLEEMENDDEENEDDISKDGMIMVKKKTSKEETKKDEGPSGSKRGGSRGGTRGGGNSRGKRGKK